MDRKLYPITPALWAFAHLMKDRYELDRRTNVLAGRDHYADRNADWALFCWWARLPRRGAWEGISITVGYVRAILNYTLPPAPTLEYDILLEVM